MRGIKEHKTEWFFIATIFLSLLAFGAFHEFVSCFLSVVLLVGICVTALKKGALRIEVSPLSFAVLLLIVSYAVTPLWATDRGMATIGLVKFLPVALFLLLIMQAKDEKNAVLRALPYMGAILTVLTSLMMQIPVLKPYFSVAGRLAGSFQYPNAFAAFLLTCALLLLSQREYRYYDFITLAILLFGILYTGSRTVLLLAVPSVGLLLLFNPNPKIRIGTLALIGVGVLGVGLFALWRGAGAFSRILTVFSNTSTFVGRLLYFRDAIPVILKHPFGTGYLGYSYMQRSFQTGVYSVRYMHNDFLQIMFDVGWLPGFAMLAAVGAALFSKGKTIGERITIAALFLHSLFDFDLQFIAVFMIFILLLDQDAKKTFTVKTKALVIAGSAILTSVSLYYSVFLMAYHVGNYRLAASVFPYETDADIRLLEQAENADEMVRLSNKILFQNPYAVIAYSAKAKAAYTEGDFEELIVNKRLVFTYAPFAYHDYEEYCYMLINGVALYEKAGDIASANICRKELLNTKRTFDQSLQKVSSLGEKIDDQIWRHLPGDINEYIAKLEKNHE